MNLYSNLENENTVRFYKNYNFGGDILIMGRGSSIDLTQKYTGFNDAISSMRIGKNCRVVLCRHTSCSGGSNDHWFKYSVAGEYQDSDLHDHDMISKIYVYNYDDNYVNLFGSHNYDSHKASFAGPTGSSPTTYNIDDLRIYGMKPGHRASSVTVPAGYGVYLYKGDYLGGTAYSIVGPAKTSS